MNDQPEFPVALRLEQAPATIRRQAGAAALARVAERLGLDAVNRLEFSVSLEVDATGDVYTLTGIAEMSATRTCIATLEPFEDVTTTDFEEMFTRDPAKATDIETLLENPEALDIELLEVDEIDVGEIALQHLTMTLDPSPRSPAAFEAAIGAPVSEAEMASAGARRPFAGLDKLLAAKSGGGRDN